MTLKLEKIAPALFVLIWSTGWIVAKYSTPHADPLTFLSFRFCFAVLAYCAIALVMKAQWPTTRAGFAHAMVSGVFLHALYLGGVWWAIKHGVPASISGLLAALQPLLTAFAANRMVGETLRPEQRFGLGLGFIGLIIAIAPGLFSTNFGTLSDAIVPLTVNVVAMIGVTFGTLYQKRYLQSGSLIPIAALQNLGAVFVMVPVIFLIEDRVMNWNVESVMAMAWSVLGLSVGAIMLLLQLIRQGQVSRAASLIYLVPPAVGIEAWLLFGEDLTLPLIVGTAVVAVGVWLVNRKPDAPSALAMLRRGR